MAARNRHWGPWWRGQPELSAEDAELLRRFCPVLRFDSAEPVRAISFLSPLAGIHKGAGPNRAARLRCSTRPSVPPPSGSAVDTVDALHLRSVVFLLAAETLKIVIVTCLRHLCAGGSRIFGSVRAAVQPAALPRRLAAAALSAAALA